MRTSRGVISRSGSLPHRSRPLRRSVGRDRAVLSTTSSARSPMPRSSSSRTRKMPSPLLRSRDANPGRSRRAAPASACRPGRENPAEALQRSDLAQPGHEHDLAITSLSDADGAGLVCGELAPGLSFCPRSAPGTRRDESPPRGRAGSALLSALSLRDRFHEIVRREVGARRQSDGFDRRPERAREATRGGCPSACRAAEMPRPTRAGSR